MANFVKASDNVVVNLDHVVWIAWDVTSVTVTLVTGYYVQMRKDDPYYQYWVEFAKGAEALDARKVVE